MDANRRRAMPKAVQAGRSRAASCLAAAHRTHKKRIPRPTCLQPVLARSPRRAIRQLSEFVADSGRDSCDHSPRPLAKFEARRCRDCALRVRDIAVEVGRRDATVEPIEPLQLAEGVALIVIGCAVCGPRNGRGGRAGTLWDGRSWSRSRRAVCRIQGWCWEVRRW